MPKAWTKKDERQYKAIKNQQRKRGKSVDRAEEIAARTVNKRRQKEGRTQNKDSEGTGNPQSRLEERTVDELRNISRQLDIPGRSKLTRKSELIKAIRRRRS